MPDVKAMEWLPLKEAIERLSRSREQVFLKSVGQIAIKAVQRARLAVQPARHVRNTQAVRTRAFGRVDRANRERATGRSRRNGRARERA